MPAAISGPAIAIDTVLNVFCSRYFRSRDAALRRTTQHPEGAAGLIHKKTNPKHAQGLGALRATVTSNFAFLATTAGSPGERHKSG